MRQTEGLLYQNKAKTDTLGAFQRVRFLFFGMFYRISCSKFSNKGAEKKSKMVISNPSQNPKITLVLTFLLQHQNHSDIHFQNSR